MKINFDKNPEGYQQAKKLQLMLKHLIARENDPACRELLDELKQQVGTFLSSPGLEEFDLAAIADNQQPMQEPATIPAFFSSLWNFIAGPSNREMELSRQRRELVDRADHAENMAYQALAEAADITKERDQALIKIRLLEQELTKLYGKNQDSGITP